MTTSTGWYSLPIEIQEPILTIFCLDIYQTYTEESGKVLHSHETLPSDKEIEKSLDEPPDEPPVASQILQRFHTAILIDRSFYTFITSFVIFRSSSPDCPRLAGLLRDRQQDVASYLMDLPSTRWPVMSPILRFLYAYLVTGRFWDNPGFHLRDYLWKIFSDVSYEHLRVICFNQLERYINRHVEPLGRASIRNILVQMGEQETKGRLYLKVRKRTQRLRMGMVNVYSVDGVAIPPITVSRPKIPVLGPDCFDQLELVREIQKSDISVGVSKPLWLFLFEDNRWMFVRYGEGDSEWNYIYDYPYACHAMKCRKSVFGERISVPSDCLHESVSSCYEDGDEERSCNYLRD